MRYLPLVLVIGCAATDPDPADIPESVAVEAVTACPSGTWCVETSPVNTLLHAVWAATADDVFAVGDGGTILRRTNDTWTAMTSGTTANLRGLWGTSPSDVWASGVSGTIVHFDGTAWSVVSTTSTADLDAVWSSSPSDAWFAGTSTVLHWNGSSLAATPFAGALLSVSGTGPNNVWATGENTNVHRWNGTSWTTLNPISTTTTYFAVLVLATNDVWVSDFVSGKETAHWNGTKWAPQKTNVNGPGTSAVFKSMSALASNNIWGVGGNRVGHSNGTAWAVDQPFGTNVSLWSVIATGGDAWIVGDAGLIAHRSLP